LRSTRARQLRRRCLPAALAPSAFERGARRGLGKQRAPPAERQAAQTLPHPLRVRQRGLVVEQSWEEVCTATRCVNVTKTTTPNRKNVCARLGPSAFSAAVPLSPRPFHTTCIVTVLLPKAASLIGCAATVFCCVPWSVVGGLFWAPFPLAARTRNANCRANPRIAFVCHEPVRKCTKKPHEKRWPTRGSCERQSFFCFAVATTSGCPSADRF